MSSASSTAAQLGAPSESRLLVFDTHPIQYRTPVFRALFQKQSALKVCFFDETFDGDRWWFHEVGTARALAWGVSLREDYPNEVLALAGKGLIQKFRTLAREFKNFRPTAVVIYGYYLPEHWMLRFLCVRFGVPMYFVGETFTPSASRWRQWLKKPLLHLFFSGRYRCVAIGEKTLNFYLAQGIPPGKLVSAKYCVDVSYFRLTSARAQSTRLGWRSSNAIPRDAFVVLFVGRLFDRKRPQDMLAIHEKIRDTTTVYTVLAGSGPLEETLREQANRTEGIRVMGFQDQSQVRDCYYGADVLVIPSEYETWGLVANEAFACGLPVIATDKCGAAHDLVVDNQTGFVFPVGDTTAVADKIRDWVSHPEIRARLGEAGQKKVGEFYGTDQFADALLKSLSESSPTAV